MKLVNPLTVRRADERYEPLHPLVTRDLLDNNSDHIVVGDITEDRKVILDYAFEMPISDRNLVGMFTFTHDGTSVYMANQYDVVEPDIDGIIFGSSIVGNEIRLNIITSALGENPRLKYRRYSIPA